MKYSEILSEDIPLEEWHSLTPDTRMEILMLPHNLQHHLEIVTSRIKRSKKPSAKLFRELDMVKRLIKENN
jgi:hypothetical protein